MAVRAQTTYIQQLRPLLGTQLEQLPAVLQTVFAEDELAAAMAAQKMWQSIGLTCMYALALLDDLRLGAVVLAGCLVVSYGCLVFADRRVVCLDDGRMR